MDHLWRTADAADRLAGPSGDRMKESALLNRWRRAGVIPAVEIIGANAQKEYAFKETDVCCAAVLSAIADEFGLRRTDFLKGMYATLSAPGEAHIVNIMMDVSAGGTPRLYVRVSWNPFTGQADYDVQIRSGKGREAFAPLKPDFAAMKLKAEYVELADVLRSFVEA